MGWKDWIWSSSSTNSSLSATVSSSVASSTDRTETAPALSPVVRSQPPKPLTPEEQAEKEWHDLLRELDQPPAILSTLPATSPLPRQGDTIRQQEGGTGVDPSLLHPTTLLPTEMSCRAAFDAAFYCQSLGGQFTNLYRYGGMRNCSEMWSNFWFCMRTNSSSTDAERIQLIRQHYWERDAKYRKGPSSEDVWQARTRKIEGAFGGDFEALEGTQKGS